MLFRFLASPTRVLTDADGRVCGLEVEENMLVPRNGDTSARGTGTYVEIPLETVVFAIGDRVDDAIGLPYAHGEFLTNAPADTTTTTGAAYQVYDPVHQKVLEHTYVVGWSRKASDGLVGKAKQDAEIGVETVLQDLAAIPAPEAAKVAERRQAIRRLVEERCTFPITKDEVALLEEAERQRAAQAQVEEYKFDSNAAMLEAINSSKASVA
jgi:ferredoxin--NADP+ reductase